MVVDDMIEVEPVTLTPESQKHTALEPMNIHK